MKFVPELGKLVKGMIKAARSVFFILMFLVLVIYVFSIIFTGAMSDREKFPRTPYCAEEEAAGLNASDGCLGEGEWGELGQDLFATMGDSFMSLFTRGVLGDNLDETVAAILDQSLILMWLFFLFLIITFATLLNMLIGVVCEVIAEAAAEEEEADTVNNLSATIQEAFEEIDTNEDGLLTQQEWSHINQNPKVRKSMASIGIEEERMEERLAQMQEMMFEAPEAEGAEDPTRGNSAMSGTRTNTTTGTGTTRDSVGLTVDQVIQKVVEIRPDQVASALDLELLKAQVIKDQKNFKAKLKRIEAGISKVFNPDGENPASLGQKHKAGNMPDLPGMPALMDKNENKQNSGSNEMSNKKTISLGDVPTAMLFQALKEYSGQGKKAKQANVRIHR